MKKILALILALMLLAVAGLAGADTLEVEAGTPSGCSIEMFKLYFSAMEESAGYKFVWNDNVYNDGNYLVYSGKSGDDVMTINIYTLNGNVVYAEGVGSISANLSDQAAAQSFGEWFGAAIGGMTFGLYIGENGAASVDVNLTNKFTNDLLPLTTVLTSELSSDEKLANGVVGTATVLGYPTGLEMKGVAMGTSVLMTMKIMVTSSDGKLLVK